MSARACARAAHRARATADGTPLARASGHLRPRMLRGALSSIPEGPPMETMQTSRQGNGTAMPTAAAGRNLQDNATTRGNRRSLASASHTQRQPDRVDQLARGLGWFSIALGAAEL